MSAREHRPWLVAVGLGSNIRPAQHLPLALQALQARTRVVALSSVWQTPPVGTQGPNFYNAVAVLTVPFPARHLKNTILQPIEAALGRRRGPDPNAPRPIDLDLLVEGHRVLDADVWRYAHWAVPLAEVMPGLQHPQTGEPLAAIAHRLAKNAAIRQVALPDWHLVA